MTQIKNIDKINDLKQRQVLSCVDIIQAYPNVRRMIIFGSSVSDRCTEQSDVDICFDIEGTTKGVNMYTMARDIRRACDHKCDILTYGKLKGRVKDEIDQKGVVVYELS